MGTHHRDYAHHERGHGHAHGHGHAPARFDRAFAIGVTLNVGFVIVEAIYGFLANSLALLADAGHNLGDVAGLLAAWGAAWLGRKRPTATRTYGYGRTSILAALANAILLLVAVGAIALEAVQRFQAPAPVQGVVVTVVAGIGIVVNGATALLFMRGRHGDLNVRGAFLHMAADAAVSAGVVVSGLVIGGTGWLWLDPATSLAIAAIVTVGTWRLLTSAVSMAIDAVPEGVDREGVEAHLRALPGVTDVHDLHIWPLSTTSVALTCHLVRPEAGVDDQFTMQVCAELEKRFGIDHVTIQVECGAEPCKLEPDHVV